MEESIFDEQKCRICGCTWDNACEGGCYWVEDDLCSVCDEKEIFVDMIMDFLIIIDLDGVAEDPEKENRMRSDLLNTDWDKLNDYYQKADELVESKHRQERIERILKEVEEIGVEAVKEKYGITP